MKGVAFNIQNFGKSMGVGLWWFHHSHNSCPVRAIAPAGGGGGGGGGGVALKGWDELHSISWDTSKRDMETSVDLTSRVTYL